MAGNAGITVTARGPLVSGKDAEHVAAFLREAQDEVSQQAFANLHQLMDKNFKHPTPYYETQVLNQRVENTNVIHDRGIVYGPWLEGVSSRNQTTRFKGYHIFRDAARQTQKEVPALVLHVMRRYLGRM